MADLIGIVLLTFLSVFENDGFFFYTNTSQKGKELAGIPRSRSSFSGPSLEAVRNRRFCIIVPRKKGVIIETAYFKSVRSVQSR